MRKRAYIANLCPLRLLMTVWLAIVITLVLPARAQQPDASQQTDSSPQPQPVDAPADNSTETMFPHFKGTRYWLSGQANFIFQTHPGFHALYSGKNSLSPHYEKATSRVLTLYTGLRLNNSTELLVDIEEAGGSALSTGLGVAGLVPGSDEAIVVAGEGGHATMAAGTWFTVSSQANTLAQATMISTWPVKSAVVPAASSTSRHESSRNTSQVTSAA